MRTLNKCCVQLSLDKETMGSASRAEGTKKKSRHGDDETPASLWPRCGRTRALYMLRARMWASGRTRRRISPPRRRENRFIRHPGARSWALPPGSSGRATTRADDPGLFYVENGNCSGLFIIVLLASTARVLNLTQEVSHATLPGNAGFDGGSPEDAAARAQVASRAGWDSIPAGAHIFKRPKTHRDVGTFVQKF